MLPVPMNPTGPTNPDGVVAEPGAPDEEAEEETGVLIGAEDSAAAGLCK
jgi:hypothetical protein